MIERDSWILEANHPNLSLAKWQRAVNLIAGLLCSPAAYVIQHTPMGLQVVIASEQESNPYTAGRIMPPGTPVFSQRVAACRSQVYIRNAHDELDWKTNTDAGSEGFVSFLGFPLFWPGGHFFGTLCVMDRITTGYPETYLALMQTFSELIEADLKLLMALNKTEEQNLIDEMTGMHNLRGFNFLAAQKLSVAKRYNHPFGLIYFDLDSLDTINEQLGAAVGDMAIQALADALRSELRDSDIAARTGSDEFIALVFINREEDLEHLATRVQRKLNLLKQYKERLPPLTASAGAKCFQANTDLDIPNMLKEVDLLMYNIKQQKKLMEAPAHLPRH
jgi:diguanylate cyclase (GGDEF)-like protein